MTYTVFSTSDLAQLPALQPPTWGDLVPRFEYFIKSKFCKPIKIIENEKLVAIGTSIYHTDSVWLACIVVHSDYQGKGLGRLITKALIDEIDRQNFQTIYLDATEFGYPVYLKFGFEVETTYGHFLRKGKFPPLTVSDKVIPFSEKYLSAIFELDSVISCEDRSGVLSDFITSSYLYVDHGKVLGYYIPDWGDGPIFAIDDVAGIELMKLRIQQLNNAILPFENQLAIQFLTENGFRQYAFSRRMVLGKKRSWKADKIFNRISGQLG